MSKRRQRESVVRSERDRAPPARYAAWLEHVFEVSPAPDDWNLDLDRSVFVATEAELVALITCTMQRCGSDLTRYSEEQVRCGLDYIFDNTYSDIVFALMSSAVAQADRLHAIASLKALYTDCFAPRCAPILGHVDEPGGNPLNVVCHMLWDVSPLAYWERRENKLVFYDAIVDVLESVLPSGNPACVESALHGLGHIQRYFTDRVVKVITAYERRGVFVSPGLKQYAQLAKTGRVQ